MIIVLGKLQKIAVHRTLNWWALGLECMWPSGQSSWVWKEISGGIISEKKAQYTLTNKNSVGDSGVDFALAVGWTSRKYWDDGVDA